MRSSIFKLIVPAWVAVVILLILYEWGIPMEFITIAALFIGWVLGRNVDI
jgi:hypothetical protein